MAATTAPAAARTVPDSARSPQSRRKPPRPRTVILAAAAYVVALIFLLPYLEMAMTALRPAENCWTRTTSRTTSPGPTSPRSGPPASARTCGSR